MNFETLERVIEHAQGAERDDAEVKVLLAGDDETYTILSLNWDDENDLWVIICE